MFRAEDLIHLNINVEASQQILHLLFEMGFAYKANPNLRRMISFEVLDLRYILQLGIDPQLIMPFMKHLVLEKPKDLPVFESIPLKSQELTDCLLALGGDVNARDTRRAGFSLRHALIPELLSDLSYTALLLAVHCGDLEMVSYLIAKSADLEQALSHNANSVSFPYTVAEQAGYTPLLLAVELGHPAIVTRLLAAGANIQARSTKGYTVFSIAQKIANAEILALLEKHLAISEPSLKIPVLTVAPFAREAETFPIHDDRTFVILTGNNAQGERFFLLTFYYAEKFDDKNNKNIYYTPHELPLPNSAHIPDFWQGDFQLWNRCCNTGHELQWQMLGYLSLGIPDDNIHYGAKVMLCDTGSWLPPLGIDMCDLFGNPFSNSGSALFFLKDLPTLLQSNLLNVPWNNEKIPKTIIDMLHILSQMTEFRSFSDTELARVQASYTDHILSLHRLAQAAQTGDGHTIQELMERGIRVDALIPTMDPSRSHTHTERHNRVHEGIPLAIAIEHYQMDVAVQLSTGSQDTSFLESLRFKDNSLVQKIRAAECVELYQKVEPLYYGIFPIGQPFTIDRLHSALIANQETLIKYLLSHNRNIIMCDADFFVLRNRGFSEQYIEQFREDLLGLLARHQKPALPELAGSQLAPTLLPSWDAVRSINTALAESSTPDISVAPPTIGRVT